jgi:hypothetical protein
MWRSVIQRLHDSEIAGGVAWMYDSSFRVWLGVEGEPGTVEGLVRSWAEAESWLVEKVLELDPTSTFAIEERAMRARPS